MTALEGNLPKRKPIELPLGLDSVLTVAETARVLRIDRRTLNRQIAAGLSLRKIHLSEQRIGYRAGDVIALIRGEEEKPGDAPAAAAA